MSSISGVGQDLSLYFQSITVTSQAPETNAPAPADAAPPAAAQAVAQQVRGAGHHRRGQGQMFKKIEAAVSDALQQAQSSGSSADPNQVVEDAIAKVLKENGTTSPTPGATGQAGAADADGDGATNATGKADNDKATRQAFFQTLKSYGIDPQQFRQDLLAAIKDARGGQIDPSTAFQSFPPGMAVDTNA